MPLLGLLVIVDVGVVDNGMLPNSGSFGTGDGVDAGVGEEPDSLGDWEVRRRMIHTQFTKIPEWYCLFIRGLVDDHKK